jgi:hypothetical protein
MASEKDLNKGVVVQDHRDWDGYRRSNHLVNWSLELVDEISFCHRVFVRGSTILLDLLLLYPFLYCYFPFHVCFCKLVMHARYY